MLVKCRIFEGNQELIQILNKTFCYMTESSINEILRIISKETGINVQDITSECRKKEVVDARYIFFAVLKKKFNITMKNIGKLCGNRDHTTVIYGLKKFEERFLFEESYKMKVLKIFEQNGYSYETQNISKRKFLSSFNKVLKLLIITCFLYSCNPKMHIIGYGMRKFNTSLNKYSKNKPYIKENSKIKK